MDIYEKGFIGNEDSAWNVSLNLRNSQKTVEKAKSVYESEVKKLREEFLWVKRIADERAEYLEKNWVNQDSNGKRNYSYFSNLRDVLIALSEVISDGDLSSISVDELGLRISGCDYFVSYVLILSDDNDFYDFLTSQKDSFNPCRFSPGFEGADRDKVEDARKRSLKMVDKYSARVNADFERLIHSLVPTIGEETAYLILGLNESGVSLLEKILKTRLDLYKNSEDRLIDRLSRMGVSKERFDSIIKSFHSDFIKDLEIGLKEIQEGRHSGFRFSNSGISMKGNSSFIPYWTIFPYEKEIEALLSIEEEITVKSYVYVNNKEKLEELKKAYNSKFSALASKYEFKNVDVFQNF